MSRLEPLPREQLGAIGQELDEIAEANGYVPASMRIMGRRPEATRNVLALIRSIMRDPQSSLDPDLTWMIAHVCSRVNGCQYCVAHTMKNGSHHGLSQEKACSVWDFRTSPLFTPAERAALEVAAAGGQCPAVVGDEEMAELCKHYSEGQIVEIVLVISLFGFHNRWNSIMQTDLEAEVLRFKDQNPAAFGG